MKNAVTVIRFLVGILFVFSGLVKANDPLGLGYKMQEFFELWSSGLAASDFFLKNPFVSAFSFLHEHVLFLSVVMITLEILAGVALIIGWRKTAVINLLLVLMIFFTFLTGYAYLSGKFRNCGCFGDCIPITPLTSFVKDLVLLGLIVFLAAQKKYITPLFSGRSGAAVLISSLIAALGLQWYALNYLPVVDCLPFEKGNNIAEQMRLPKNAVPDSFAIRFVYEKEGKQHEFAPENLPADLGTYKFVKRTDKLVRKGNAEPPLKGFALTDSSGADFTNDVLNQPECFLLIGEDLQKGNDKWIDDFKTLVAVAGKKGIPVYVVTSSIVKAQNVLAAHRLSGLPVFSCDYTAIRTAARTNPTLYRLRSGTVEKKFSHKEIDAAAQALQKG